MKYVLHRMFNVRIIRHKVKAVEFVEYIGKWTALDLRRAL